MAALPPDTIVAVIGAGAMGTGIAQVAATAGHSVLLYDANPSVSDGARGKVKEALLRVVDKGKMNIGEAQAILGRVLPCGNLSELAICGLVVEAIVEDVAAKAALFGQVERSVREDALIVTNTSSLSITSLASSLSSPERFAGLHFFNPAPVMPLVEVVTGLATDSSVADTLIDTMRQWRKEPILVKDSPGFVVNRGARPYYSEPLKFAEERGADFATIDALLKAQGFKMGPFELIDLVGLDINLSVSRSMWEAYYGEPRYKPSPLVEERVAAGRLGKKSGRGFYAYPLETEPLSKLPKQPTPKEVTVHGDVGPAAGLFQLSRDKGIEIDRTQGEAWIQADDVQMALTDGRMAAERGEDWVLFDLALDWPTTNLVALCGSNQSALGKAAGYFQALGMEVVQVEDLPGMLSARTLCMLVNEACDTLLRGVAGQSDIDLAMKKGLNFPGGPFEWLERIGVGYCVTILDNMARSYGDPRYRASVLLRRWAAGGRE